MNSKAPAAVENRAKAARHTFLKRVFGFNPIEKSK
jgi:hypothetical protein